MKKGYILITGIVFLLVVIMLITFKISKNNLNDDYKNPEIKNKNDLTIEYGDIAYISDFIDVIHGELVNQKINYSEVGNLIVEYQTLDSKNNKEEKQLTLKVIDTTPPVVMLNNKLTLIKGTTDNLNEKIMCADNYDRKPKCEVNGQYDLNKIGIYPLTYVAEDSMGNQTKKDFELHIIEKNTSNSYSQTLIQDIIESHKTENTKIGIDVSKWQGNIDWKKVKASGVEFAMIRVGTQGGFGKENYLDKTFITNIEGALKESIEVGIYFYSYATTKEEAISQANWVVKQIKDYDITLPVVFDWESWNKFNELALNLHDITSVQETFLNQMKNAGYKTARYGSKNYLTNAWQESEHLTWLAHYTSSTDYDGKYFMWQLCNNGIIDGINGYVDINVLYEN